MGPFMAPRPNQKLKWLKSSSFMIKNVLQNSEYIFIIQYQIVINPADLAL